MPKPTILALLGLLLSSCGYRMVRPEVGGGRTVSVPTADNHSQWLGIEVGLTQEIRADLQRQLDIRLSSGGTPSLTLRTTIEDVGRRSRVALRSGGAAIGISQLNVHWEIFDAHNNKLGEGVIRRDLEFLTSLDEDARQAFAELFVEIAQQIALEVGYRLEQETRS